MPGHMFVTHGDLLALSCDAVLVTSGTHNGKPGHIASWNGLDLPADRPVADEGRRAVKTVEGGDTAPAVWVGHTGATGMEPPEWYAEAIVTFIRGAAADGARLSARPLGDERPLLGVPIVGTGAGGMRDRKGEVVKAVVKAIVDVLAEVEADVVFVLNSRATYAAVQQARARYADRDWAGLDPTDKAEASRLAALARADRLVLFMGAGTGIGAGLPTWRELLRDLAGRAGVNHQEQLDELLSLDPRDAGLVLNKKLRDKGCELVEEIRSLVDKPKVSLLHQLLASLPVTEAVTTNYDVLFERAWDGAGRSHVVLPGQSARDAPAWLLHLHGSINDPGRIVLSRDDYLRFEGEGTALAGLVQAMLLTRHVLFVGYSLSDDNFHRLVHQVRGVVGPAEQRPGDEFATAVSPDPPSLANDLWSGDVRFVTTDTGGVTDVRRLAVLLDYVAFESSASSTHLLDESFKAVFNDEEWKLRECIKRVQVAASSPRVRPALRRAVNDALSEFGSLHPEIPMSVTEPADR